MVQAREQKQFAAANGALRLIGKTAGLLEPKVRNADIKITKVTVILDNLDDDRPAIEGVTRELPSADEAE